jgi:endonuclease/exonuclease/phosphatase family metal-dependent hydrolase
MVVWAGGPASAAPAKKPSPRKTITVMTRNLYLGANLDPIVHATSIPGAFQAVAAAWAQVQANDFPTRATAIAGEIARSKPGFVGFQELALYRMQTPSDFLATPAKTLALDYETALKRALRARKLRYRFVGLDVNTDVEMPSGYPATMDIRLTLRNALLVRNGIRVRRVRTGNYPTTWPVFGGLLSAVRGWVSVDATVGGRTFRVVTTHLESFDRAVQEEQSKELLAGPANTRLPVLLLGDLNSRPDGSTTASYANFLAGGFQDAWARAYPDQPGFTDAHPADLHELGSPFNQRIDYVLMRGGFRALRGAVTGENPSTRVDGLWPSDHGGLWMTLRLPDR